MAMKQVALTDKAYDILTDKVREIKLTGKSASAAAIVSELIIDNLSKDNKKD